MANYASLQSSIQSAVASYESYKGQSLRLKLDGVSLADASPGSSKQSPRSGGRMSSGETTVSERRTRPDAARKRSDDSLGSLEPPRRSRTEDNRSPSPANRETQAKSEFRDFVAVAESYETSNFLFDLDFLLVVLDFMRSEHPHTSNSLQKSIKARNNGKKKLWSQYTVEMQGLARAYTTHKPLPLPSTSSQLSPTYSTSTRTSVRDRRRDIAEVIRKLETSERTCAESILSALSHLHSQAIKDIHARYSMPDPIGDKTTSVRKHNERVRVFNQLIKFVCDDLRRIENLMKTSGHVQAAEKRKDKRGSGVVDAVESLCVEDYPPYGGK